MADKMTVPEMEVALPTMTGSMARTCVAQLEGVVFTNKDQDSLDIINAMASKLRARLKELGEPVRLQVLGGDDAKFNDTQTIISLLRGLADVCRARDKAELAGNADSLIDYLEGIAADLRVDPSVETKQPAETKQPSENEEPGQSDATPPEATPAAVKLGGELGIFNLGMVPYNGKLVTKVDVQKYIDNKSQE